MTFGADKLRVWTVCADKTGTVTQCTGVAQHIDPRPRKVIIRRPVASWKIGPLSRYHGTTSPPDIVISCGGLAVSHVRAVARACAVRPFAVHLAQLAPQYEEIFDLAFVSRHDWSEEMAGKPKLRQMIGVPHQITAEMLAQARPQARARYVPKGSRAIAVFVGGPNAAYLYDDGTVERLLATVQSLAEDGWAVLVSTSRRSRPDLLPQLLARRSERIAVWDWTGENPYRDFLAAADALLITKDSVTMCCEALASGRPTFVFDLAKEPGRRLDKFEWFHNDLSETLKLTRRFTGAIFDYDYTPLAEGERIAAFVRETVEQTRPDLLPSENNPTRQARKAAIKASDEKRRLSRTQPLPGFEKVLRSHREWLEGHGLLERPWLILGAAPNPAIPSQLPANTAYVYIRFSGRSARRNGLPDGDLTLLPRWKDAQIESGLDFRAILRIRRTVTLKGRLNRLLNRRAAEAEISTPERDDYVIKALGSLFPNIERRPSNGVALICFALVVGIKDIIIAGISFDSAGHEYEASKRPRRHIAEDQAALKRMAELYPGVSTTEESLSRATGIPLYLPAS